MLNKKRFFTAQESSPAAFLELQETSGYISEERLLAVRTRIDSMVPTGIMILLTPRSAIAAAWALVKWAITNKI